MGGRREEILLLVFLVLGLVEGDVGKGVKVSDRSRRGRGAGDDVDGAVWNVEKGVVFNVLEGRPDKFRGNWDKRSGCWGSVSIKIGTWEIPSIVVRLEDFEDSGGSISDVLLIYIIEG